MKHIVKIITFLLTICVVIRLFVGEPCYIPSESMESTLYAGDLIWVDKVTYGALLPNRFADIPLLNVFTWLKPLRIIDEQNNWKSRRNIGCRKPIVNDIIVFRNPQNRNILLTKRITNSVKRNGLTYYYVMGDNLNNSIDSRSFGEIPETVIMGKVNLVLFSTKDWRRLLKLIQ